MATIRCLNHSFEAVQAVLFDKDGTLADVESYLRDLGYARSRFMATHLPEPDAASLQSSILSAFGLSDDRLAPTGLLAVGSRYDNEIAAATCLAMTGNGWVESVNCAQVAFVKAESALAPKVQKTPMLTGASELLAQLVAVSVKVGIVSSDLHTEVAAFVDHYQLSVVSWYCGSAPAALPKTHPDFLAFACESMVVDPKKTLIIGDSAADYALAGRGALGFLGMTGGWREPPNIAPTAKTFSDLRQVEVFD